MIIRQEQMSSLKELSRTKFELRMAEHLTRCFPAECQKLGAPGMEEIIRYGISRAESHGINGERDVCKYIDLMMVFGREFDVSPECPWASRILDDDTQVNATVKTERLFAEAKLHTNEEPWSQVA